MRWDRFLRLSWPDRASPSAHEELSPDWCLEEQVIAPISSSTDLPLPPLPNLLSPVSFLQEPTVHKQCTCRRSQPSGRSGHEVGRPPAHRGPNHRYGSHLDPSHHPPRWSWCWPSSNSAILHQPRELSDCSSFHRLTMFLLV